MVSSYLIMASFVDVEGFEVLAFADRQKRDETFEEVRRTGRLPETLNYRGGERVTSALKANVEGRYADPEHAENVISFSSN